MKRPWQPNKRKRQKTHGFLIRMARKGGGRIARIIRNRRKKGRHSLAPQAYSK